MKKRTISNDSLFEKKIEIAQVMGGRGGHTYSTCSEATSSGCGDTTTSTYDDNGVEISSSTSYVACQG